MDGLMQPRALTIAHIIDRAERLFSHKRVITAGSEHCTYRELTHNVRRLATSLEVLDVPEQACVATFASNNRRHLELYAAVPATKRILHTLNTRLASDQLEYIIDHAGDDVVFVDRGLFPRVQASIGRLPGVRYWVVMPDGTDTPVIEDPRVLHYDSLLAQCPPVEGSFEKNFSLSEENLAAGLCYTSGTTGRPKGVLYSHRSTVLHTFGAMAAGLIGISERDVVMPIVPMFHANAWGLPYAALMAGADLVLPGASTAPLDLLRLMSEEQVTIAGAVPTVWTSLVPYLDSVDLSSSRLLLGGGSAIASSLSEAFRKATGVSLTHSWGMTEVSPVGAIGGLRTQHDNADLQTQIAVRGAQGQQVPLINLRIVDVNDGTELPWDSSAVGELQVCGPWVAASYFGDAASDNFTTDGWLRTGDLARIDADGYLSLVDRIKDLIKSGGEWISSVELETALASHPEVAEVAVIARPDPRWAERPVAYVVLRHLGAVTADDLLNHLSPLVAKWWLPDEIVFVEQIPKTATGKLSKAALRDALSPA